MARTTNGAPEFLRRAEAADAGTQGYSMDERREPPIDLDNPLGPDDYGRRRPSPSERVNLARLESAIGEVAAEHVAAINRPTRLQRIAEDMLDLRWEEFVALADGVKGDAKVMHEWAKANKSGAIDA